MACKDITQHKKSSSQKTNQTEKIQKVLKLCFYPLKKNTFSSPTWAYVKK